MRLCAFALKTNMLDVWNFLIEPLRLGLMQRGLAASLIVALLCAVIGTFVVLRGLAFLGDALGHAVFPGVVVAYLINANLLVGGLAAGLLTTTGISLATRNRRIKNSTAIGIFYTVAFAAGALLLSRSRSASRGLSELVLGNVLAVQPTDLILTACVAAAVLLTVAVMYKEFVLVSFDPQLAAAHGRNVAVLDATLFALLTLAIVAALQTVGNVLVVALLVVPPATARLAVRRIGMMMALAAALGALSTIVGVYASYYLSVASGGAIVLCACAIFFVVLGARSLREWLQHV
jgi:ABC-type Mn2+/Zn2+ transport system permease subunit